MKLIHIHPRDNVAVALEDISAGEALQVDGSSVTAAGDVKRGHKLALCPIPAGAEIIKYGCAIGTAREDIAPGAWVHVHNVRTGLSEGEDCVYAHRTYPMPEVAPRTFLGYRRPDGRAAIRNELWIIPTVGCVNSVAQRLAHDNRRLAAGSVEGIYAFTPLFEKKGSWIDFNAGTVAQGESLDAAGDRLLDFVLEVASGKKTRTEERGFREISIFKDGVVL